MEQHFSIESVSQQYLDSVETRCMKFLMICSYLPSVLNFRGKLLEAIHAQGYEIHVLAPGPDGLFLMN